MKDIKEKLNKKYTDSVKKYNKSLNLKKHFKYHDYGLLFSENDCRKLGDSAKWLKDYQVCIDKNDELIFRLKGSLVKMDPDLKKSGIKNIKDAISKLAKKEITKTSTKKSFFST